MLDFKFGFLAKFCVIEGISEIMYIHTYYIFLVSVGSYVRCLYPRVIISGHIYMKSRIYPIPRLGIDW